jgi:hypothetical protein
VLEGRLVEAVRLTGTALSVAPGPARLRFSFFGGSKPAINRGDLDGDLRVGDRAGRRMVVATDGIWLDGTWIEPAPLPLVSLFEALVDALADVRIQAEATPAAELSLRFPAGVEVLVPNDEPLVVTGATRGPASELVLCAPLELSIGGAGVRLSHRQLRWLASAVQVAVSSARLHPNGSVDLEGGTRGKLGRLVQGGLDVAGEQLSELVRTAPQFERVRSFLKD